MTDEAPMESARELIARGEQQAAIDLLLEHADDPRCVARLREILLAEGRREGAADCARRLASGRDAEAAVSRSVLAFLSDDLVTAEREARAALAIAPDLPAAHHHLGRALHNAGRSAEALRALRRATELDPAWAEGWNGLGHALRANDDLPAAVGAFRKALMQAPGLRAAWHNLGTTLFHMEEVKDAAQCFERMLRRDGDDVDALLGQGLCAQLMQDHEAARQAFRRVTELEPENALGHLYLGILHNELTDSEAAIASLKQALRLDPDEVEAWVELTGVYEQSNRLDEAAQALSEGLRRDPRHPGLLLEAARQERRGGDSEKALGRLRAIDAAALRHRQGLQYWQELGLALDRAGDADGAVRAFEESNRLAQSGFRTRAVDPAAFERRCARLDAWLDDGAPGLRPEADDPATDLGGDLCFLVGFPRSGTTLVDTTLATGGAVSVLEEAATLDFAVRELEASPTGYPQALAQLDGEHVARLRQGYRRAVSRQLGGNTQPLVIDKMPLRFLHAGLIQRLFPASRLVFVLRHPCDVVLSNFMQQYAVNETNIHFHSLHSSAATYDRIMRLWQRLERRLGLPVLYVRYEDLVADMAGAMAPVCDFVGMDRERIRLDARARLDTRDRVRTSSYQQVAEPIYDRAVGRWERYRKYLDPLLPVLRPHLERYGYATRPAAAGDS